MEAPIKNYKDLQECEKTLTTPFSINDILTKEHSDSKCDFENGTFEGEFGAKMNFLGKPSGCFGKEGAYSKKDNVLDKGLKYYDNYRDFNEEGVLDMSRKNAYPVTELSGKFSDFNYYFYRLWLRF